MTSPIISVDVARRLNEIIQNTLDSRLFLFCNYEPTNSPAVSENTMTIFRLRFALVTAVLAK